MVSYRYLSTTFILFTLLLLSPYPSLSEELLSQELPVEVYSKSLTYDKEGDIYIAEGDAVVVQGGLKIEGDRIVFKKREMEVIATGNVVVTDEGGSTAKGERLEIDLKTKTGFMDRGDVFYKPENLYIKGERLIKLGKETYRIEKGRFTTCDCTPPEWSFSGSDVKVTRDEYLTSRHTFFYIKDVPILYSPYVVFPVKGGRQTGFLTPRFGYSDFKGVSINNAFFWAISRNTDATFYLDYDQERGIGKGIQYRYIRKRGSEGEIFLYHYGEKEGVERIRKFRSIEDNRGHPQDAEDDRWMLTFKHSENLPYGIRLKADITEVSDDEYFLDFYRDPDIRDPKDRDIKRLESNLTLSKGWGRVNLVTQFRYFDDLLKDNDKDTLQRLPQIDLTGSNMAIPKTPFYLSFNSSYVRFERREGIDGHRIDLHPKVSLPLKPWGLFELTPQVGLRGTQYWVSEGKRSRGRELYDLSLNLETTFIRIFALDNERKLRHTIRPQVVYSYIQDRDQTGLPYFDAVDRIAKENKVTYSITSLLTGRSLIKGEKAYHDYLFFKLSQSYDINEATRRLGVDEKRRPFSLISGELNLYPFKKVSINTKGDFDPYGRRFNKYTTSLGISDRRGDTLDLSYNYNRDSTNYIDLSVGLRLTNTLQAFHRSRFSHFKTTTGDKIIDTLETVYGLRYQKQCWGIELVRIERPDEMVILATINLLGLGEVAHLKGKLSQDKR